MIIKTNLLFAFIAAGAVISTLRGMIFSQPQDELRETFEHTYPLAADGRVSLNNYTGTVQIMTWERAEVKMSAVKRSYVPERLTEVKINIASNASYLNIESKYAQKNLHWSDDERGRLENSARVDYVLTVPRGARLDKIELHNGTINLDGVKGDVVINTLNGNVSFGSLTGNVKVSTLNGRIEATLGEMGADQQVALSSVNGQILASLVSENVRLSASTMNGKMTNDFGRNRTQLFGKSRARLDITNLNGGVTVRRAAH